MVTRAITFWVVCICLSVRADGQAIDYEISFPNAAHHEAEIEIQYTGLPNKPLKLVMSQASPGRYAIHNFAKNVYNFEVSDSRGKALSFERVTPHEWRIRDHGGAVHVRYTLFADHADGTYSAVDTTHAHLNMPATFMWARGLEESPITLNIKPASREWTVATQLASTSDSRRFTAHNLAYFLDSPVETSEGMMREWLVGDGKQLQQIRLALHHQGSEDEADVYAEMAKLVVDEQRAVFGKFPHFDYGTYTFLADYLPYVRGDGMEHRNSTVLSSTRSLSDSALRLLGTLSHEFFHVWNMERIRSAALEPFDFEGPNLSRELWFGEGFTNYYDDLIIHRAGLTSLDAYVTGLSGRVNAVLNRHGRLVRSAAEMSEQATFVDAATSIDAHNRHNTFLSYYTFGDALALGLDLLLRTEHNTTLDSFMRWCWETHGITETHYTTEDLKGGLIELTNDPAFVDEFFSRYVEGHDVLNYEELLGRAGLLVRPKNPEKAYAGYVKLEEKDGKVTISDTYLGTPLHKANIERGSVIVDIDGVSVKQKSDVEDALEEKAPGESIVLLLKGRGGERTVKIKLDADPTLEVVPFERDEREVTLEMKALRASWLGAKGNAPRDGLIRRCADCKNVFPLLYKHCPEDGEELEFSLALR